MSPTRQCPNCQRPLFFSGNGRSLICETCDYTQMIQKATPSLKELEYIQTMRNQYDHLNKKEGQTAARIRLAEGKEMVQNGRVADAFDALVFVLKSRSTELERGKAWYWLSHLFDQTEEKRRCLGHALALAPNLSSARKALAVLDGRLAAEEIVDPDQLLQNREVKTEPAVAQKHACPQCDGPMLFKAEKQTYRCDFCGFEQTIAESSVAPKKTKFGQGKFEQEFLMALATAKGHLEPINLRTLQCQSCTTDFLLNPKVLSVTCPFCGSVFVTETAESREIMPPHAMLPFSISREQAETIQRRWFKKQQMVPDSLAPLHGVYLPLWTFDIGGEVRWHGTVYRNERLERVSGGKLIFRDDVLVPGCQHTSKQLVKNYEKFDLTKIEAYDERFLAQWPAERYTFPLANASLAARSQVLKSLRRNPHRLVGHMEMVHNLQIGIQKLLVESYKLLLLPVWIGHYMLDDTTYELTINGQTGDLVADQPLSFLDRVFKWFRE